MNTPPSHADLDPDVMASLVSAQWGLPPLALSGRWWDLGEVAVYTVWFAHPHEETEDMRTGFSGLRESLEELSGDAA